MVSKGSITCEGLDGCLCGGYARVLYVHSEGRAYLSLQLSYFILVLRFQPIQLLDGHVAHIYLSLIHFSCHLLNPNPYFGLKTT